MGKECPRLSERMVFVNNEFIVWDRDKALPGICLAAWPKKPVMIMIPWPAENDPSTMGTADIRKPA